MAIFNGWRITRAGIVFIIGIIVLAVLVFGGIWLARERGEQARRDEAIQVAEETLRDQSDEDVAVTPEAAPNEDEQTDTGTVPQTATGELPATGPELGHLLAVLLLTLAGVSYIQSRRALQRR